MSYLPSDPVQAYHGKYQTSDERMTILHSDLLQGTLRHTMLLWTSIAVQRMNMRLGAV